MDNLGVYLGRRLRGRLLHRGIPTGGRFAYLYTGVFLWGGVTSRGVQVLESYTCPWFVFFSFFATMFRCLPYHLMTR